MQGVPELLGHFFKGLQISLHITYLGKLYGKLWSLSTTILSYGTALNAKMAQISIDFSMLFLMIFQVSNFRDITLWKLEIGKLKKIVLENRLICSD
jgi:hypothetical protein